MQQKIKRLVVKVGTSTLTYPTGNTNLRHISRLVEVLSDIMNAGVQTVLVSSGAIGVGVGKLGLGKRPDDLRGRQAAAAVGQCELMFMYDKLFSEYSHTVAQLLVTKSDLDDPERRENLLNTFDKLLEFGCVPVVNENDSVAVDEIVYGDNDCLSADIAVLTRADALVILSDIDGLYDADPARSPGARLIPTVHDITDEIRALAGGAGTSRGTGGMKTKLHAAELAGSAGIDTYVVNGTPADNLYAVLEGRAVGTHFKARCKGDA